MSTSTRHTAGDLDLLAHYTGRQDPESHSDGESLDVLLQLTLPIVLILALFVVTQLEAVENAFSRTRKQLNQVNDDLKQTEEQLTRTGDELTQTREELGKAQDDIEDKNEELRKTEEQLTRTGDELTQTRKELGKAQDDIEDKNEELRRERSGEARRDLIARQHKAIITLQEKYLREATEEAVKEERARITIDDYRSLAPSSHSLSKREVGADFIQISKQINKVFRSTDTLEKRLADLDCQILDKFADRVSKHFETHTDYNSQKERETMEAITPENEEKYQRDLRARMEEIRNDAFGVQIKMIHDAYDIPGWVSVDGSNEEWNTAYKLHKGTLIEGFINLKVDRIIKKIEDEMGIFLLPHTRATARQ